MYVWGPQGSEGQQGDTQVSIAREPRPPGLHRQGTPTPKSPSPGNPRPPGLHRQGTPDPKLSIARETPTQHEASDNEASSNDKHQWENFQPAIDDTPSEQLSQGVTVRQQSVTRNSKVSGKKQARDRKKKKTEFVNRGRRLARAHSKRTKLDFEQRTRDSTPKRTRSDTGYYPGSKSMSGKHTRLTDTGDVTQSFTSQPS